MNKALSLLFIFISIVFYAPAANNSGTLILAQNDTNLESYFDDNVDEIEKEKDKKKKKKKDEVKDEIRIDGTFFISIILNLLTLFIILRLIYLPNYGNKDFMFTFFLFNIIVFLLTYLLNHIKISMGAAFGLFAIFSMLRYRTEDISTKDMTYLFVVIAVGLIGAIKLEYYELATIYGVIILSVYALDGNILMKREYSKMVLYENINLIQPDKKEELLADLRTRTGHNVHRISITKIDFLQDSAVIKIYYYN
jgi:hypothetical protein